MGGRDRFFSWLLRKLALALALTGCGLAGVSLWNYARDPADFAGRRAELVRSRTREITDLKAAVAGVEARRAATRIEIEAQRERATQAAKVSLELEDLSSGLNRLTTSSEQLKENEERRERMRQMVADSAQRVTRLEQVLTRMQWEKDGLEIALARAQQQLATVTATSSAVMHYAREAWAAAGRWILLAVALVMTGPFFWRLRRKR